MPFDRQRPSMRRRCRSRLQRSRREFLGLGIAVIGQGSCGERFSALPQTASAWGALHSGQAGERIANSGACRFRARGCAPCTLIATGISTAVQRSIAGPQVTSVSYDALQPVRTALLHRMQQIIQSGSGGPELMETTLARISPEELGMTGAAQNQRARSLSGKSADARFWHADIQHDLCAVGGARSASTRATRHTAGAVHAAAASTANE